MVEHVSVVRLLVALLVLAAVMTASFVALKRFRDLSPNLGVIKILNRVRVSRTAELMVVEVEGNKMLLSVGSSGVSKIADLATTTKLDGGDS